MGNPIDTVLQGTNALYLEEVLRRYKEDPNSVDPSWREFFEREGRWLAEGPPPQADPGFRARSIFAGSGEGAETAEAELETIRSQGRVFQLINAYRVRGHLLADLDPLGLNRGWKHPELDPYYWGFTSQDMDREFSTVFLKGPQRMSLRQLLAHLRETYSRTIGVEFMHIHDIEVKEWLQERFERSKNHCTLDPDTMVFILEQLSAAEAFEDFLHTKYRGAKRFSLQGAESLVPMLSLMIEDMAKTGVREIVFGMAHRGRLNVLANILEKDPRGVFKEFEDPDPEDMLGRGDVKYHMGHSSDIRTRFGDDVHLSLTFNPSHLEAVDPVVMGRVRAKQDRDGDVERRRCVPVLIHGDAAFSGQGVVAETMNMMKLDAYTAGGTIHIIVNNQIGFTTLPEDGRSTPYCTDLARMAQCPIIHVNGEDPEAVVHAARVASDFRQTFGRDVIIDMYCFRRFGHNEGDEPTFTQPLMYKEIAQHPPVHEVYGEGLVERGLIEAEKVEAIFRRKHDDLDAELQEVRAGNGVEAPVDEPLRGVWDGYTGGPEADAPDVETHISRDRFERVVRGLVELPEDLKIHRKLQRLLKRRAAPLEDEDAPLAWGMGELLAYGALVLDGHPVRLTGQDSQRGTFSHRHAILTDTETGRPYSPLNNLSEEQAPFEIHNSLLSEAGVVGFEFGYSLDRPEGLTVWEAQFGDFVNGAQVMIDQFIVASEDKWNRLSGLTMLLPHGYEGQGPEHSSARLERFLQLGAEDNIVVANVTTPAQMFHMLRRQVLRPWRKPLVVMTPKSLLRHKLAVSRMSDFTGGRFHKVIAEDQLESVDRVERAVLCSGKVYYDLLKRREKLEDQTTALIRVEQLYPLPEDEIHEALGRLGDLREIIWCQEEPANMGARNYLHPRFARMFEDGPPVRWVSRSASASPATGSHNAHDIEQEKLLEETFGTQGED
ncbi:MAG: 2-oxoglutarate dehydrogenase E1 component [Myxococcota bacterium]